MERVRRGGSNQVIRYCRWDDLEGPLTLSSADPNTGPQGSGPQGSGPQGSGLLGIDDAPNKASVPIVENIVGGESSVGCCEHCGAKRRFEFQIMPQLLHFLRVDEKTKIGSTYDSTYKPMPSLDENAESVDKIQDPSAGGNDETQGSEELLLENKKEEDLDWGTIDVYTCTASCSPTIKNMEDSTYIEECTYMQRPISFVRTKPKSLKSDVSK